MKMIMEVKSVSAHSQPKNYIVSKTIYLLYCYSFVCINMLSCSLFSKLMK